MEAALLDATGTAKHGANEESAVVCEIKKQLYLAGPLVVGFRLLQNMVQMVSVMFVGHLGELALASASLATSFAGVTGFSLLAGMACSLDTLCGQAFGARQHHQLGVYKQRAMLVLALASVPVAAVWAYTGEILTWCGQDPEIAAGAGSYIRWLIPALFVYGALQCHVRFLQTQNLVMPVMLSSGATALCHPAVCWVLVRGLGLGRNGAALANAISYLANLSFLAVYVRASPACETTWTGFSAEAFRGVPDFLRLAVPSAVMVCLEWWSFELLVLLSGLLPNPKLETAVLSICLNTSSLAFMAPLGLGAAIRSRPKTKQADNSFLNPDDYSLLEYNLDDVVGHRAARECRTSLEQGGPTGGAGGRAPGAHCGHVGRPDHSAGTRSVGVRVQQRGGSDQVHRHDDAGPRRVRHARQPAVCAFRCCQGQWPPKDRRFHQPGCLLEYLAGIPAAFVFAFVCRLGGMGLWFGILCGLVVQMLSLLSITLCTNWNKEALKAKNRVFSAALPVDMET